jgi:type II secretory pathway pseudopilin PulG
MKKYLGFTLIELLIFIIVTSILASTILLTFVTVLQKTPTVHNQMVATQTAQQCMEWFIGQRRINKFSSLSCPSSPSPSICTAPTGFSITNNIACTTINSDSNYKTITVTVSGNGDAVLTALIADY